MGVGRRLKKPTQNCMGKPTLWDLGEKYHTDKATHRYDGGRQHKYAKRNYPFYLECCRDKPLHILEIGIWGGASLRMWEEYFPKGKVTGIDINPECAQHTGPRTKCFIGDQMDTQFLENVVKEQGVPDVVIDDGIHQSPHILTSFKALFPLMPSDSYYFIEDLRATRMRDARFKLDPPVVPDFFAECAKDRVGYINAHDKGQKYFSQEPWLEDVEFIHFWYEFIVVKKKNEDHIRRRP